MATITTATTTTTTTTTTKNELFVGQLECWPRGQLLLIIQYL